MEETAHCHPVFSHLGAGFYSMLVKQKPDTTRAKFCFRSRLQTSGQTNHLVSLVVERSELGQHVDSLWGVCGAWEGSRSLP